MLSSAPLLSIATHPVRQFSANPHPPERHRPCDNLARMRALLLGLTLIASLAGCAAAPIDGTRLAQTRACNTDADCHMRVPPPRACPGGGQSIATACCRMNFCGVCWSDCPGGGAPHSNAAPGTVTF